MGGKKSVKKKCEKLDKDGSSSSSHGNAVHDDGQQQGVQTRSQSSSSNRKIGEISYYTQLNGGTTLDSSNVSKSPPPTPIQVISKRKLKTEIEDEKDDPYSKLAQKFEAIKEQDEKLESGIPTIYFVVHFNVFLYAASFFIQIGSLPYLTKSLGADPVQFGHLQTAFALLQLLGGPIYGRMGDLMGERVALLMAFASSAATYFITGIANSMTLLFISRIPSIFMHTMQGSQMILTYLSHEKDRANVLAKLGFSYGLGMVAGPTIGGYVTKYFGEQSSSLLASSAMVISFILVFIFIPYVPKSKRQQRERLFNIRRLLGPIFAPGTRILLFIKLMCGIPIGVIQSMFSIVAIERFGLPPEQNGMLLSYIGGVSLFMQGVGIGALTARVPDKLLMKFSAATLTVSYYAFTLVNSKMDFVILLFPMTCSLCLVNSILTSSITKTVSKSQTGTILGLNMAVHSTIKSLSPSFGGYLMTNYGVNSLGFLGIICNVFTLALINFAGLRQDV